VEHCPATLCGWSSLLISRMQVSWFWSWFRTLLVERGEKIGHGKQRIEVGQHDFPASHGDVFVVGWDLNKAWKHEVLKRTD